MAYKKGEDRRQRTLFPDCIDDYVGEDAPVRLMDAFVDRLDMEKLGFHRFVPADTGAPGYNPRDLLKLYTYGYYYEVRSSRKLARQCLINIEVMWLLSKLAPDFRTISDFRKDNKAAIEKTFKEFNRFCYSQDLFSKSYVSIDGSKFKAVNAKDRNFTLNKLDGTAKGGIVIAIKQELGIPVKFIGVGEKIDDMQEFDAADFVRALFGE